MKKNLALSILIGLIVFGCVSSKKKHQWDIAPQLKASIETSKASSSSPNIIIIMADDLGKYDISAYGSDLISTPNIDNIGKQGVQFQDAYVTSPICAPSRAAILTGKYQQRYGFETQPMEFYPSRIKYALAKNAKRLGDWNVTTGPIYPSKEMIQRQGIPLSEVTLSEVYKSAGYATGIVGKWHLGIGEEYQPLQRGFDFHYGFLGAFSRFTPEKNTPGYHTYIQTEDYSSNYQWKIGRSESAKIMLNGKPIIENEYLTFAITDRAKEFVNKNKDTNFFLYLSYNAPHVPFQAPDAYYDQFSHIKDENQRVYLAMIKALDDAIGDFMHHLESLNLLENTIVYFISDNGGASYTKATTNAPLSGGKITMFEGGVNVPFMMQWKGTIAPGTKFQDPVSAMDIFTTSVVASKIKLTHTSKLDGVDLMPYIQRKKEGVPHEKLYWRANHIQAIRYKNWKLILSTRDNWLRLYNLASDKSEQINLGQLNPAERDALINYFEEWNSELPTKPLWPRIMDRKFIIGEHIYYFPA